MVEAGVTRAEVDAGMTLREFEQRCEASMFRQVDTVDADESTEQDCDV